MRGTLVALVLLTVLALGLRLPDLGLRPMHNDEAVNAVKLRGLWEQGAFRYDPNEYHGPVLYYAALPAVWLSGARDFSQLSEASLRVVPVVFCAGLILLLWFMADGLGRTSALFAGLLTALSPAMVFYSRYFIHEMLLIFFTMLLMVSGWRYSRNRRLCWALLGGAALGLMYSTKETFLIPLVAMLGAAVLTMVWGAWHDRAAELSSAKARPAASGACSSCIGRLRLDLGQYWNGKHFLASVVTAGVVSAAFFTSFFTNFAGLLDAVRTYAPWLHRAGGASPHVHPWHFYLERLIWFHHGRGPVWSEVFIFALAAVGAAVALRQRALFGRASTLLRFLAFYSALMTFAYTVIPYKTPWCLLGFWHGIILLAGAGLAILLRWQTRRWLQAVVSGAMLLSCARLGWQAWETSFVIPADPRNPYVYAQTSPDIMEMVEKIQDLSKAHPLGEGMLIQVMAPGGDYWPLPWYLRRFQQVGWWESVPPDSAAPVMVVGAALESALDESIQSSHTMTGIYSLRPRVFFDLYVDQSLWNRYLEAKERRAKEQSGGK